MYRGRGGPRRGRGLTTFNHSHREDEQPNEVVNKRDHVVPMVAPSLPSRPTGNRGRGRLSGGNTRGGANTSTNRTQENKRGNKHNRGGKGRVSDQGPGGSSHNSSWRQFYNPYPPLPPPQPQPPPPPPQQQSRYYPAARPMEPAEPNITTPLNFVNLSDTSFRAKQELLSPLTLPVNLPSTQATSSNGTYPTNTQTPAIESSSRHTLLPSSAPSQSRPPNVAYPPSQSQRNPQEIEQQQIQSRSLYEPGLAARPNAPHERARTSVAAIPSADAVSPSNKRPEASRELSQGRPGGLVSSASNGSDASFKRTNSSSQTNSTAPPKRRKIEKVQELAAKTVPLDQVKQDGEEPPLLLSAATSYTSIAGGFVKAEPQSPSIATFNDAPPARRLITEFCSMYQLPDNCRKTHSRHHQNRQDLYKKEAQTLKKLGFTIVKGFFRDDGMVIEWTSKVPVWSDTLLPEKKPQPMAPFEVEDDVVVLDGPPTKQEIKSTSQRAQLPNAAAIQTSRKRPHHELDDTDDEVVFIQKPATYGRPAPIPRRTPSRLAAQGQTDLAPSVSMQSTNSIVQPPFVQSTPPSAPNDRPVILDKPPPPPSNVDFVPQPKQPSIPRSGSRTSANGTPSVPSTVSPLKAPTDANVTESKSISISSLYAPPKQPFRPVHAPPDPSEAAIPQDLAQPEPMDPQTLTQGENLASLLHRFIPSLGQSPPASQPSAPRETLADTLFKLIPGLSKQLPSAQIASEESTSAVSGVHTPLSTHTVDNTTIPESGPATPARTPSVSSSRNNNNSISLPRTPFQLIREPSEEPALPSALPSPRHVSAEVLDIPPSSPVHDDIFLPQSQSTFISTPAHSASTGFEDHPAATSSLSSPLTAISSVETPSVFPSSPAIPLASTVMCQVRGPPLPKRKSLGMDPTAGSDDLMSASQLYGKQGELSPVRPFIEESPREKKPLPSRRNLREGSPLLTITIPALRDRSRPNSSTPQDGQSPVEPEDPRPVQQPRPNLPKRSRLPTNPASAPFTNAVASEPGTSELSAPHMSPASTGSSRGWVEEEMAKTFLSQFITAFVTDRPSLIHAYSSDAVLSCRVFPSPMILPHWPDLGTFYIRDHSLSQTATHPFFITELLTRLGPYMLSQPVKYDMVVLDEALGGGILLTASCKTIRPSSASLFLPRPKHINGEKSNQSAEGVPFFMTHSFVLRRAERGVNTTDSEPWPLLVSAHQLVLRYVTDESNSA